MESDKPTLGNMIGSIFFSVAVVILVTSFSVMAALMMTWVSINIFMEIHFKIWGY